MIKNNKEIVHIKAGQIVNRYTEIKVKEETIKVIIKKGEEVQNTYEYVEEIMASEEIKITTAENSLSVSIDGFESMQYVDKITIKSASQKAMLAFLNQGRFYNVLRNKLHWGISPKAF